MASYDFFLAHAEPDASRAEQLYDLLTGQAKAFLDSRSVPLGVDWDRTIAEAQRESRVTVVLVSANTGAAFYQREEIAAGIHMARRNPAGHKVVPVYLDINPPDDLPYGLRLKTGLKVSRRVTLEQVAVRLLNFLGTMPGGTAPPTAADSATPKSRQDRPPAHSMRSALRDLRKLLARLIPDEDEAKRIVRDSDAPTGGSWWTKDPQQFWQGALDDADRAARMEDLFAEIDQVLERNGEWRDAKLAYWAARDAGWSPDPGIAAVEPGDPADLTLSAGLRSSLAEALAQIAPWVFRDSRVAVKKVAAARTALSAIDPFVTAWGEAAAQATWQPQASDLQKIVRALRTGQTKVALALSALESVRAEAEAVPLCADLNKAASGLLDACRRANDYVI